MEKLSMCRICLSDDTRLQSIFGTHLQETYEFLTMMLLVTEDSRPSLACDLCCSRLEACYELKKQCLRSEELFMQLLRHKGQVKLRVKSNMHPSMEDVMQTTANVLDYDDMKREDAEAQNLQAMHEMTSSEDDTAICDVIKTEPVVDAWVPSSEEDPLKVEDHLQSSDSKVVISLEIVKEEQSDVTANDAAVEQDANHSVLGLHTECDMPLDIVKQEPDDVDSGAQRLAAQKYRHDKLLNSLKRTDQTMDKVEERKRGTRRTVEDTPVEKNKIMETGDTTDIRLSLHHNKRNNSTSDHSEAHKEMSENKISADQSVISSSSDKLSLLLCDTCQKCFRSKDRLIRHIRTHTGEKPYECNVCKKCFSQTNSLVEHIRTHTGEKPYECNVCKKRFSQKGTSNRHTRIHTDVKR